MTVLQAAWTLGELLISGDATSRTKKDGLLEPAFVHRVAPEGIFVPGPGQELATRSSARVRVAVAHKVRTLEPRAQTHTRR